MKRIICACLAIISLLSVLPIVGCAPRLPEVEYTLAEDATFVNGGVKYGLSDKGLIALEVVDRTLTEVRLYGYVNEYNVDEATDAFMAAIDAKAVPTDEVYAIAGGFLNDNDTVEYLVLPSSLSLGFFEEGCIVGCDNLKKVKLHNDMLKADITLRTERNAFSLADDTVFSVCNLERLGEYAVTLETLGKRLVYDRDVYFVISADVDHTYFGADTVLEYVSATYEITARIMGGKRRKIWFYQHGPEDKYIEKIASAGDTVKYSSTREKLKIEYTLDGCADIEAWVLKNHMPFSCKDEYSPNSTFFCTERNYRTDDVYFELELEGYLTFQSDGDRD